ncbi:hypothetical protein IFM89_024269 [Coptis chinensis]|uniref:Alkyl transferase n=1 Tax=Coptis chinensis TaxID=261450 RepID=A0A835HM80_9MAGN|nr:hypothetical protein IFM89_024269 [Coptis chinensis]
MESLNKSSQSGIKGLFASFVGFLRKCIFHVLSVGPMPTHIAFIMDGNRRYARKKNLKEGAGHRVGFLAFLSTLKYGYELGVKYVTVYAFSIDNFKRRAKEVQYVMDLLDEKLEELLNQKSILDSYGVRIRFIGNLSLLNESTRVATEKAMAGTAKNDKAVLLICLAYSSTDEIVHAVQEACNEKWNKLQEMDSNERGNDSILATRAMTHKECAIKLADLERHMYLSGVPDPDILIRSSGESRLSNFLLWQTTYCHLYSPAALWPEISLWTLLWAILNFQQAEAYLEKKKKLA